MAHVSVAVKLSAAGAANLEGAILSMEIIANVRTVAIEMVFALNLVVLFMSHSPLRIYLDNAVNC